jgi:DNA-binding transcriptional MerR regulator
MMQGQEIFTTGQVCRLAGATARQLDHWAWTGFLQPSGQGTVKRRYSFDDLVRIRVVMRLKDQGVTLQMIRKAVEKLQEYSSDPLRELSLVGLNGDVFIYRNRNEAVRALDGQSAFLFMDIGVVAREMDELLVLRRAEQTAPPRHHVA